MDEEIKSEILQDEDADVFQEALAYLQQKAVVSYADFKRLREWYRPLAFSVSGYTSLEVLNAFLEALQEAVESGTTKRDFREQMNSFLENQGYDGMLPYHADTIFRQNLQTAYNVGHYQKMTDPDVMERRKYWQYQTAGDNEVREEHRVMDGRVYAADDPIWDIWYPPNGFGCRCAVVSRTEAWVKSHGITVETMIPTMINPKTRQAEGALPDKGFRTNPAKAKWTPNLVGFPEVLRKAWEEREQKAR